ncbi:MAG TPA: MOSC domain-containing protein [bacterium]|nr:MOSC domain-containing protein [bacterium]
MAAENRKGRVLAVCASERRGTGKRSIGEGELIAGYGLKGDAHAGSGPRQLAIIEFEKVRAINREKQLNAEPGDFAENIATEGIEWDSVAVGTRAKVGDAEIKIIGRGKPEHGPGDYSFRGEALLAGIGIFAEITVGGSVKEGDSVELID